MIGGERLFPIEYNTNKKYSGAYYGFNKFNS